MQTAAQTWADLIGVGWRQHSAVGGVRCQGQDSPSNADMAMSGLQGRLGEHKVLLNQLLTDSPDSSQRSDQAHASLQQGMLHQADCLTCVLTEIVLSS